MLNRYVSRQGSENFLEITAASSGYAERRRRRWRGRSARSRNAAARRRPKNSSDTFVQLASVSLDARRRDACPCSFNNHNLRIDWSNLDKKEFMKMVGGLDIGELFAEVQSDRVQRQGGKKKWQMGEYVLQRKDRRMFVGGQGFVVFVRRSQHSSSLAMKVCLHSNCSARIARYQTKAELQLAVQSQSRFVSDLLVHYSTEKFFVSVMYKAKYSSLKVIKRQIGAFPPRYIKYYAACVMDALLRLHRINVCHKDVKADNVLVDHRGIPQLADFGLAVESTAGTDCYGVNKRQTSMQYYPPECLVLGGQTNDYRIDTWLYGFYLGELCISSSSHMWTKYEQSTEPDWRFRLCDTCHIPREEHLPRLLRSALRQSPRARPLLHELATSPYFDKETWGLLQLEEAPQNLHVGQLLLLDRTPPTNK